jgi:hypothetical protein
LSVTQSRCAVGSSRTRTRMTPTVRAALEVIVDREARRGERTRFAGHVLDGREIRGSADVLNEPIDPAAVDVGRVAPVGFVDSLWIA